MWKRIVAGVVVAFTVAGSATARPYNYYCTITTTRVIGANGDEDAAIDFPTLMIDRLTGLVTHPRFGLNGPAVKSEVLNSGNSEWSFKAISFTRTATGIGWFVYVEVDEFADGLNKPMRMISDKALVGGACN